MFVVALFYLLVWIFCLTSAQQPSIDYLAVARCRSQCITAIASRDRRYVSDAHCKKSVDCYICWDHCQNLAQDWDKWSSLCQENVDFCRQHPGCRHACRIMSNMVPVTKHRTVIRLPPPQINFGVNSNVAQLTWMKPKTSLQNDIPVSWVFFREQDGPWRTLLQTLNNSLQFNVIRQPQDYSFSISLISSNGPTSQTPVIKVNPDMSVKVLKNDFILEKVSQVQSNAKRSLEAEWRQLIGGVGLLSKRLDSLTHLSNTSSLLKRYKRSDDGTLPIILGVASTIVGLLIIGLVAVTCYFHRNQSQQLEDMRSSFHAWSSRLGSSFRSSMQIARHSLKRRSARSSSTAVGSTDSGVVLTSSHAYAKTIAEV